MPTMRVHSTKTATPHFPWLWGEPYASLMRAALDLRYQLLPYHYSLAHRMHTSRKLWIRPLAAEFPSDPKAAPIASQWLDGDLLVAPILSQASERNVYLPAGTWYAFNSSATTEGPATLGGTAALAEVPVYVRPGAVVPLAPVVQHSGALPGGALEVQVYAGADGSFTLVEDDGESTAYASGAVRSTRLAWDDGARTLSWAVVDATAAGTAGFSQLFVRRFDAAGVASSAVVQIGKGGSVKL